MTLPDLIMRGLEQAAGMATDEARAATAAIIAWGAKNGHAGDRHYWPSRFREMTQAERDAAIRKHFNGRNLGDVRRRFGVSNATIYRALRRR